MYRPKTCTCKRRLKGRGTTWSCCRPLHTCVKKSKNKNGKRPPQSLRLRCSRCCATRNARQCLDGTCCSSNRVTAVLIAFKQFQGRFSANTITMPARERHPVYRLSVSWVTNVTVGPVDCAVPGMFKHLCAACALRLK